MVRGRAVRIPVSGYVHLFHPETIALKKYSSFFYLFSTEVACKLKFLFKEEKLMWK